MKDMVMVMVVLMPSNPRIVMKNMLMMKVSSDDER